MHPNLKLLSFSSRRLLHNCPRKFELYRLLKKEVAEELDTVAGPQETVHLDFGHLVGYGCQLYLCGWTQREVWMNMFKTFHGELDSGNENMKGQQISKSFWHALHAVDNFSTLLQQEPLSQYELVWYESGKALRPATELSFRIDMGDDFYFRGKLDALLRHKYSGRFAILETKTTSYSTVNEATYKNSEQGLGYSVVVDAIAHSMDETIGPSYDILYPVYQSKQMQWTIFRFPKSAVQRALWLKDVMMDVAQLKEFAAADFFPMRGNNCYVFGRQCEYFGACDMSTKHFKVPLLPEIAGPPAYDFLFTIEELIEAEKAKLLASTSLEDLDEVIDVEA